jgi:benzylsuccinate CoA-transferase BbsF subunit
MTAHQAEDASRLPLSGVRVIDFTWVGAGPFTTKVLADFGAEVVKIESRARPDQLRKAEPLVGSRGLDESGYFAVRNPNKKSVTINMKHPDASRIVLAMARRADVIANSFSPGVMERFGLSYEKVAPVNPSIIYLSMPMAGKSGPYRDFIGYGMSIAALTGMFGLAGLPGRAPVGTGTNFPDHLPNPLHAAFAVLAALEYRARTGEGQEIIVSQIDSTLATFPDALLDFAANRRVRRAGDPPWDDLALRRIFPCAGEDRWCALSVQADQMPALLRAIGERPDADPSRCEERIGEWTRARRAEDAVDALRGAGIATCVVATPKDLLDDHTHLAARGFWQRLVHSKMGPMTYQGIAARLSRTPTSYRSCAPLLGQHNDGLAELSGLPESEIAELTASGAIA